VLQKPPKKAKLFCVSVYLVFVSVLNCQNKTQLYSCFMKSFTPEFVLSNVRDCTFVTHREHKASLLQRCYGRCVLWGKMEICLLEAFRALCDVKASGSTDVSEARGALILGRAVEEE